MEKIMLRDKTSGLLSPLRQGPTFIEYVFTIYKPYIFVSFQNANYPFLRNTV
jgi:hypothetical protein